MIQSFEIKDFRLFEHLKINHLGRVNLIVGKNNSGKSALLEALMLYHSKFSTRAIVDLLKNRMEHWDFKLAARDAVNSDSMRHFFKNHIIPEIGEKLSLISDTDELLLESAAYVVQKEEMNDGSLISRKKMVNTSYGLDSDVKRCLLIKIPNMPTKTIDIDGDSMSEMRLRHMSAYPDPMKFVSPQGVSDEQVANMWDMVALLNMEKVVLEGLKLIEPLIEKLAFVKMRERRSERIPIAKLKHFDTPVPLKSLGDGMMRILNIILSLVSCEKGSILVVDEFENGLHWSVHSKVWEIIFELAKKLDVQVFASTHSRDCVAGFYEAWAANESDGAFLRLMRGDGQPPVQEYDLGLLRGSLESIIEVR